MLLTYPLLCALYVSTSSGAAEQSLGSHGGGLHDGSGRPADSKTLNLYLRMRQGGAAGIGCLRSAFKGARLGQWG